ncbi:hypothetical protein PTTG_03282 [Puccinia triticina 1-1 BBBD Race 1]|uniref:Chromatin modification-related protein EAF7 n=2 Tax=Puccinia triticina TaxID=208348 RepID=A0A180GBU5_PUCT1|nr:uncharacterized protein PtA15_8A265 [Puccinia triticina]OAV90101.1 hypothetical protein PTTG_03282 [Puccinia triticina 1-1 BBBD Race 1]WAQ87361.1 hypothetical protein PtA15_8A265 [Puccinia triticina]WAR57212.1 hypothetical protein PtB15_8B259 [Puccinia triticina]
MASSTTETSGPPGHILSTTDGETAFFRSIIRYRPRGSSRHFSMVGICKDLERELQTVIPSDEIWKALRTCYDLDILAEMEPDEPDEIERSKSTIELLRSKQQTFFREFQLPIHPTIPAEQSFQSLVDERRLESSSGRASPEQRSPGGASSPRRRTTTNSLKLHLDRSGQSSSRYLNPSSAKAGADHRPSDSNIQEGMESDLTEQEDYEDEDDDDDDAKEIEGKEDEEEDEEEEPAPGPRAKKPKTSNKTDYHPPTTSSSRSRNTGNSNKASIVATTTISNSNTPSTSRSRTRGRWKR